MSDRYPAAVTSSVVRRTFRLSTVALAGAWVALAAGPAAADTPENWPEPDAVSVFGAVLLLGGVPLLVFVATALLVYAPSVARGESLAPGGSHPANQWLGGPRRAPEELAAPDGEESAAGGAGGTW